MGERAGERRRVGTEKGRVSREIGREGRLVAAMGATSNLAITSEFWVSARCQ